MPLTRRLIAARVAIVIALLASAALTVDHVRPGPGYCPLEQACEQASQSALGSFLGVPTSALGMAAFAILLLLSLPATPMARRLVVAAAGLGVVAGLGFLGYQAFALGHFCPLCVVADTAAVTAGILLLIDVLGRPTRWWRPGESIGAKVAWGLGGALAMLAPFAWPQEAAAPYEEAVILADEEFTDEVPAEAALDAERALSHSVKPSPRPVAEGAPAPGLVPAEEPPTAVPSVTPPAPPRSAPIDSPPRPEREPVPAPVRAATTTPTPTTPVPTEPAATESAPAEPAASEDPVATPVTAAAPEPATAAAPEPANAAAPKPSVRIVEYLNAYCPHCRKMHARMKSILASSQVAVKRRRIYAWASNDYPLWARACAFARTRGLEDEMFEALMETRSDSKRSVRTAAMRVGLDPETVLKAIAAPPPSSLIRDRQLARSAKLKGLPTFDIGRRRITGEKSERALRAALAAAARAAGATSN